MTATAWAYARFISAEKERDREGGRERERE